MANRVYNLLRKFFPFPEKVPSKDVKSVATDLIAAVGQDQKRTLTQVEREIFARMGRNLNNLQDDLYKSTLVNFERIMLYREIDRALMHWMVGCLSGGTKIRLCDGRSVPIRDMASNSDEYIGRYVWSVNSDMLNAEPDKILDVKKTGVNRNVIRVHFDKGEYVDCTPDHKFMLRDGSYREAKDLVSNESLMPFYSRKLGANALKGYECIYNPKTDRYHYVQKISGTLKGHGVTEETRVAMEIRAAMRAGKARYQERRLAANRKVVKVEYLTEKVDVYDISTEKNHNFSLSIGIFVHNSAAELYADYATLYDKQENASVWATSRDSKYANELNKLFERLDIEEKVYDWAYTTGSYGDLFVELDAVPGLGVVGVNDDYHPMNISRMDSSVLIGYYKTPHPGLVDSHVTDLLPPWDFVHFRVLGSKKRRSVVGDPLFSQYSSVHFLSTDNRQMSNKYGVSLLQNSLAPYKRLRLAEDSLLMARATRGVLKYLFKVKVDSNNVELVSEIVDQYCSLLKEARAINTSSANPYFDSQTNLLSALEDIVLPVWDNNDDLQVEELGGNADIRWIADIVELRNQLASSLRTPLALMGGFVEEATGALGATSIEKLDIRFARAAKRLQRSMIMGFTRLCQIHLAYMEMDPDPRLFQIHMSEPSTAEEEELKANLDASVDVISKFMDMVKAIEGTQFDESKLFDYISRRVLRMGDFNIEDFVIEGEPLQESDKARLEEAMEYIASNRGSEATRWKRGDLLSYLPTDTDRKAWESTYKDAKVTVKYSDKMKTELSGRA